MNNFKENFLKAFTKDNIKYMVLIAIIDAITSQIFMDMNVLNFRISVSVILLPIYYYYNRKLNPIATSLFIAVFGLFFRSFLTYISYGSLLLGFWNDYYIVFFDLSYGFFYYYFMNIRKYREKGIVAWFATVWACDFFSNSIEIITRIQITSDKFVVIFNKLLLIGLVRAIIATLVVFFIEYYRMIFRKEKELDKYKEMIGIVSDLKSELYFMKSNMIYIEDVMKDAYSLYETSENFIYKSKALKIAKDVHEVKKNYQRVLMGMELLGEKSESNFEVDLSEILDILKNTYEKDSKFKLKGCKIIISLYYDLKIKKHYYMMSMLRNIVNNSLESFNHYTNNYIKFKVFKEENILIIEVSDNGKGIHQKDLEYVFKAGYSTKFNEETGDIYRGMGLAIIKEIVEKEFLGKVYIKSKLGIGTKIILKMPIDKVKF